MTFSTVNWSNPLYGNRVATNTLGNIVFVGAPVIDSTLPAQWLFFNNFHGASAESKTGIMMYARAPNTVEALNGTWPNFFLDQIGTPWVLVKEIRPVITPISADYVISNRQRWCIGAGVSSTGKEFDCDDTGYILAAVYGDHLCVMDARIMQRDVAGQTEYEFLGYAADTEIMFRTWGEVFSTAHEVVSAQAAVQTTCTISGDAQTVMWCHTTSAGNCSVKVYKRRLFTFYSHSSFTRTFDSSNVKLSCTTDGSKVVTCKTGAGGSITVSTYSGGWSHVTLASGFTTVRSAVISGLGTVIAVAGTSATNDSVQIYKFISSTWVLVSTQTHSPTGTVTTHRHSLSISSDGKAVCSGAKVVGNADNIVANYLMVDHVGSKWLPNEVSRTANNVDLPTLAAAPASDYGVALALSRDGQGFFVSETTKIAEIKANPLSFPYVNVYRKDAAGYANGYAPVPVPNRRNDTDELVREGPYGYLSDVGYVDWDYMTEAGQVQWRIVMMDGTSPLKFSRNFPPNAPGTGVYDSVVGIYASSTGAVTFTLDSSYLVYSDASHNQRFECPAALWGGGRRTLYIAMSGYGASFGSNLVVTPSSIGGWFKA